MRQRAVLEPIPVGSLDIIMTQRSISGSPNGSPVTMATMLEFAARHDISPQTEHFPMDQVNEARNGATSFMQVQHLLDCQEKTVKSYGAN
jgi:uncharacterized zinc-type alcohol dehydrogenase-like protein